MLRKPPSIQSHFTTVTLAVQRSDIENDFFKEKTKILAEKLENLVGSDIHKILKDDAFAYGYSAIDTPERPFLTGEMFRELEKSKYCIQFLTTLFALERYCLNLVSDPCFHEYRLQWHVAVINTCEYAASTLQYLTQPYQKGVDDTPMSIKLDTPSLDEVRKALEYPLTVFMKPETILQFATYYGRKGCEIGDIAEFTYHTMQELVSRLGTVKISLG